MVRTEETHRKFAGFILVILLCGCASSGRVEQALDPTSDLTVASYELSSDASSGIVKSPTRGLGVRYERLRLDAVFARELTRHRNRPTFFLFHVKTSVFEPWMPKEEMTLVIDGNSYSLPLTMIRPSEGMEETKKGAADPRHTVGADRPYEIAMVDYCMEKAGYRTDWWWNTRRTVGRALLTREIETAIKNAESIRIRFFLIQANTFELKKNDIEQLRALLTK
ncbi:MAG: hypothetical protein JW838_04555 [Spirochaetes bacterium]|nr:hypothetical protein [Spirochaetota bacterium]